ncbi:MAG: PCMD domain-containing protein [Bacteroidales bacterium]|nr:PCMD domain-containing protein [Bacteroidales bacterium]
MKRFSAAVAFFCLAILPVLAQEGPQLYNMNFNTWSRSGVTWNPFPKDAAGRQRTWDTANKGLSILGMNSTVPEEEHVAVKGGKAAKLVSRKVFGIFAAGSLYTGTFGGVVGTSGAKINFGVPFKGRPKSLSGYYHYLPGTVDYAKPPYLSMKGKTDVGKVDITLAAWAQPKLVNTTKDEFSQDGDPDVIAAEIIYFRKATNGYVRFEIPLNYKDDRIPSYVVITAASSAFGAYYTGSTDSVLYIDDLRFNY